MSVEPTYLEARSSPDAVQSITVSWASDVLQNQFDGPRIINDNPVLIDNF